MDELSLVQKVDLRIALAASDAQLQQALHQYLAPVLLKLASPSADVRQAVFSIIKNTFPRISAARNLQLPVDALLEQAKRPKVENADSVRLYSLLFLSKGVDRMSPEAQRRLVPKIADGMDTFPASVAARLFSILVKLLATWRSPERGSAEADSLAASLFSSAESEFFLSRVVARFFLLLPSAGSSVVQMPGLSFEEANFFTKDAGVAYKSVAELTESKIRLLEFLKIGFSDSALVLPLLIASADPLSSINDSASTRFRKLDYDLTPSLVDRLVALYTGVPNKAPPVKEVLQEKILTLLYRADMSQNVHIRQICDIGLQSSYAKLRQTATSFVKKVTSDSHGSSETDFSSSIALRIKEGIVAEGWPLSNVSQTSNGRDALSQRELQYETLGEVMRNTPVLWRQDLVYLSFLFDSLEREPADLRSCLQSALSSLAVHLPSLPTHSKARLKQIAKSYLSNPSAEANLSACKYVCVKFVNVCFPFSDPDARLLCLLGSFKINGPETVDEANRGLDPYLFRVSEMSAQSSIQFPSFSDMVVTLDTELQTNSLLNNCIGEAMNFALKLLVMSAVDGKSTVVAVDEDWGHRVEKALETDAYVRELLTAEIGLRSKKDVPMDDDETVPRDAIYLYIQMCFTALSHDKTVAANLRLVVSMCAPETVASLGIFSGTILGLFGETLSDATSKDLCQILAVIVSHPAHEMETTISVLENSQKSYYVLGFAYLISRLAFRQRLNALSASVIQSYLYQLTQSFANVRFYDLCAEAVGQLAIFGVLGPENREFEAHVHDFRKLLQPRAKSCHEKSIVALACLELANPEVYQNTSEELSATEELVFSTHVSKQFDYLFAAGDALSILAGGWSCGVLQSHLDIQGEHVVYVPAKTGRMAQILSHILSATLVTKPSLRRASCIWLLALVQHSSHAPEIKERAAEIHFAFMRFLAEKDEILQDCAARGLSIVYELGDSDLKDTLVKGLIRSFTDSNTSSQLYAGSVGHDTQLFEKDTLRTHDSSITTYKDVLNLAQDVGDPGLVYKFMSLAKSNALWSSRKGMAYGLGSVLSKSSLDQLLAKDDKLSRRLIPKLYRYRFDPNSSVSQSMNDIWKSLIHDGAKTVGANFNIILNELLSGMGSREWRTRQASVVALGNLLQTQSSDKYDSRLEEIWTLSFRSMDDVKESVRKEGLTLAQNLAKSLVRTADLSTGKTSVEKATSIVSNLVPFLTGTKGLLSDAEEVRVFALDTVLKLCKIGGKPMQAHVPKLLCQLVELMSTLEPEVVNYLVLNAEKYNLSASDVDAQRLQSLGHSPLMDGIEQLLGLVNKEILPAVVSELKKAIKKSVGLPSKVCASRVVVQLITGHLFIIRPYGNSLLAACATQFKDKSLAVAQSYAVASGYCCKIADIDAVVSYGGRLKEMYLGGEDSHTRRLAAVCVEAVGKYCGSDKFQSISAAFLPLVFIGKHDDDKEVVSVFEKAWIENASGSSAVKMYFSEIFDICEEGVKSPDYKVRQLVARTIVDLCDTINNFSEKELNFLFNVLLDACTGKSWSGKEMVFEALVKMATKNVEYLETNRQTLEKIEKTVSTEQKRRNIAYQAKAVRVSALFLKKFPNRDISASYVQIMANILTDEYLKDAELVDEIDYAKMSDSEAVALEETHLSYMQSVSSAVCFHPPNREVLKFLFETMETFTSGTRPLTWRTALAYNEMFKTVLSDYSEMPKESLSRYFPILLAFNDAYRIEKYAVAFVRNCQLLGNVFHGETCDVGTRVQEYLGQLELSTPSSVVKNEINIALESLQR